MNKTIFGALPLGSRFSVRGRSFVKIAMSFAEDAERMGNVFMAETEVDAVEPDGQSAEGQQNPS
jgi:hypothetical protein